MPRELSNDERHAFEAAYQNLPVNPKWSEAAIHIYYEIRRVVDDPQPQGGIMKNKWPTPWKIDRTPEWNGEDSYAVLDANEKQIEYLYGVSKPFAEKVVHAMNAIEKEVL